MIKKSDKDVNRITNKDSSDTLVQKVEKRSKVKESFNSSRSENEFHWQIKYRIEEKESRN